MSLGRWLDDAFANAQRAATAIGRDGIPVTDLLAAFYARDRAWMSLARMADLIRGARAPKPVGLATAARQLKEPTATPIRLIAAGAHAAVLRPRKAADVRLAATGPATRLIIDGADAIAVAADILATHIEPRTEHERALRLRLLGDPATEALARNRHLTMIGAGIAAGVERAEAAGELARLADAWIAVDLALARGSSPATAYLGNAEAEHLRRWTTGPFPALFAEHMYTPPAVLLRRSEPATAVERSTGPRPIDSYSDVLRTVTDISSAVKRDPQQLTARLLGAVARIGFGTEVLAGHMSGDREPSPQTVARATRWKNVARALAHVRDPSDTESPAYAQEASLAADWIRDQTRNWPDTAPGLPDSLEPLQRLLGGLAAQSIEPWRRALTDGRILTATIDGRLATTAYKGIRHAQLTWTTAVPLDRQGREVLYRLADAAADAHPIWTRAASTQAVELRTEEAIAGHGPYATQLRQHRKRLRLAAQAHNNAATAQRIAAETHARLQYLRSDRHYTEERPRTAAQKDIRQQADAIERELAHQQQQWEIAHATAAQLAQAAEVPAGHSPGDALQRLKEEWDDAIEAAVARDIQASVGGDVRSESDSLDNRSEALAEPTATPAHTSAGSERADQTSASEPPRRNPIAATVRNQAHREGPGNAI